MDRHSRDDLVCTFNIIVQYMDFLIAREEKYNQLIDKSIQPNFIQNLSHSDSHYVIEQNERTVNEITEYINFLSKIKKMFSDYYSVHYINPLSNSIKETDRFYAEHKAFLIKIINSLSK